MSIDSFPPLVVFVGMIAFITGAIEVGYLLGRAAIRRSPGEKESPVSAMAGSVLGLTAFMLAFTFGIVSNRFDSRKELVREEANAIGTAYLRVDFLPEEDQAEARRLFRQYVDDRLEFASARPAEREKFEVVDAEAQRIQGLLWKMAVSHAGDALKSDLGALYFDALNAVIDIHALRVAVGVQARVPGGIWLVLFGITFLGMTGVGYQTGIAGSRGAIARVILAVSFSLVVTLIASLDSSDGGTLRVSQQPMISLRTSMTEPAP